MGSIFMFLAVRMNSRKESVDEWNPHFSAFVLQQVLQHSMHMLNTLRLRAGEDQCIVQLH